MSSRTAWPTVAVVIPALNEEPSLPGVLAKIPAVGRVIVVDNGSQDATAQVALTGGADVVFEPRRGYGSACLAGIRHAMSLPHSDNPIDIIVVLDADQADDPTLMPLLVDPILDGRADLVLSDRTRTATAGALMPHQRYGNSLAVRLMDLSTGHRYRDMGPFRAIRLASLERLGMVDTNYGWNVEMQMKAVQHGLRIVEMDMPYRPRVGISKISGTIKGTFQAGTKIIWSVWRYRARR